MAQGRRATRPHARPEGTRFDLIETLTISLSVIGAVALLASPRLGLRRGIALAALCWPVAAGVWAGHQHAPMPLGTVWIGHVASVMALLWTAAAVVLRRACADTAARSTTNELRRGFEYAALGMVSLAVVLLLFEAVVVGLLRTGVVTIPGRLFEVHRSGLLNWALLLLAGVLHPVPRRQATPLFWVLIAGVIWSALMIPVGDDRPPTALSQWRAWTLWLYVGSSLVLFGFVVAQGVILRRRRQRAWPDRLEWLTEDYPAWPGLRPSAAAVGMGLLPLGAFHADAFLVFACSLLVGISALLLAHRLWNSNFGDIGMAHITLAVVALLVAMVPEWAGGPDLESRMPLLLAASMIGLAIMTFIWQWLPTVWHQQLRGGMAWTTTGRLLPHATRMGVIVAAFAALGALQLAFWPTMAATRDDSLARWILGLTANVFVVGLLTLGTRLSGRRSMAGITLVALAVFGAYVVIRFPDNAIKFWVLDRWPILLALLAPITLAASVLAERERWRPFAPVLQFSALVIVPAAAVGGTVAVSAEPVAKLLGKLIYYDVTLIRTVSWLILAVHFAVAALLPDRRPLLVASTIFVLGVAVGFIM